MAAFYIINIVVIFYTVKYFKLQIIFNLISKLNIWYKYAI